MRPGHAAFRLTLRIALASARFVAPKGNTFAWAVGLGLVIRLIPLLFTVGTNDVDAWYRFAVGIREHGLAGLYTVDPLFNHPPIPAGWAVLSQIVAGENLWLFPILLKFPMFLADVGGALLLWRIWSERGQPRRGALAAILFAWSIVSILVTGFHGNTDSLYAVLCLLSVYLFELRARPFLAALALGAAINIKLIPIFLIPPLLASCRTRRDAGLFLAGLAIAATPFLPLLVLAGPAFYRNVIAYNSFVSNWGLALLLGPLYELYRPVGRFVVLGLVLAFSIAWRWRGRQDRFELCALTFAIFLVFTPGFGVQYAVMLIPLALAVDLRFSALYSLLAGVFLVAVYAFFLVYDGRVWSIFTSALPLRCAALGLLAWIATAWWLLGKRAECWVLSSKSKA